MEKKLRRAGLSLKSFAKNLNRKCHCFKDCKEDWNTKMALSEKRHRSSQSAELHSVATLLWHCFEMKAARQPIIRIKYSLFSLSTQMFLPGLYLWQLIPVRSLYSLRGFEVLQPLIVDCLQSAFSRKIRLVLISSNAIVNHDVIITIRDWDHISSRAYALVSRGSRLCRLRA